MRNFIVVLVGFQLLVLGSSFAQEQFFLQTVDHTNNPHQPSCIPNGANSSTGLDDKMEAELVSDYTSSSCINQNFTQVRYEIIQSSSNSLLIQHPDQVNSPLIQLTFSETPEDGATFTDETGQTYEYRRDESEDYFLATPLPFEASEKGDFPDDFKDE